MGRGGYIISTGQPKNEFMDCAVRHVFFKQGIIGVKVKILLPTDLTGRKGVKKALPDSVKIHPPKEDQEADILPEVNQVLTNAPVSQPTRPEGVVYPVQA